VKSSDLLKLPIDSWRAMTRQSGFMRQQRLAIYLLLVAGNTLIAYGLSTIEVISRANLFMCAVALSLLVVVHVKKFFVTLVNLVTAGSVFLVVFTACYTGGIHSPIAVWLNVMAVPVLLLLGPQYALIWIVVDLLMVLGLTVATWHGWVANHLFGQDHTVLWAYIVHVFAMLNLMTGVRLYDHLNQMQLKRIHQGNEALKVTHQELIQAQAHKDEFVAAVGHELRTPMNAILGFNGVLRREFAHQPEDLEVAALIRRSTEHLLQLVNDILDFSQLQAGKLQLTSQDFDLSDLLKELSQRHHEKANNKGLMLQIKDLNSKPWPVRADRQRLSQILNNLIDNAIKFTKHGSVFVSATRHADQLRFEVSDTGPGIEEKNFTHIFRRFEYADLQTTRVHGGTGLGLTLCEKLVNLMGGKIGVYSQVGHGAEFWFEIPYVPGQLPKGQNPQDLLDLGAEALKILVVDDNTVNLMVAKLQLKNSWPQSEITTAPTAHEALKLLDERSFDLALVDMIMPDMDGLVLTQEIKRRHPDKILHMPIIALTANTNPVDRERCLSAGMNDVLHKPMDNLTMVRVVTQRIHEARGRAHARP
jgi:signal transduction histidine kinase/ActR/RegA family two-component response regulator